MTDRSPRSNPRVCFVSLAAYAYFDSDAGVELGGAERQLSLVSRALVDEFDVHFVAGDYGQAECVRREGITFHRAYTPTKSASVGRRLVHLRRLFSAMRRADADVFVYRGATPLAVVTFLFATVLRANWVYNLAIDSQSARDEGVRGAVVATVFGTMLRSADAVVAQTDRQRDGLRSSYGVESTVVPNGYPRRPDEPPTGAREEFLFVGRFERQQKRPHLFLDLADRLPETSFVLVGSDGPEAAYVDEVRTRAQRAPNVTFVGRVDPDRISAYYERAVALVNTSAEEGFPNTFLEAWRCGTPVLSLSVDPGRFLEASAVGYADGDFETLVALVDECDDAPTLQSSIGRACRRQFETTYDIETVANRYAAVLASVTRR